MEDLEREVLVKSFTYDGEEATQENFLLEINKPLRPGLHERFKHDAALDLLENSEEAKVAILRHLRDPDRKERMADYIIWMSRNGYPEIVNEFAPKFLASNMTIPRKMFLLRMLIPMDAPEKLEPWGFAVPRELILSALRPGPEFHNAKLMAIAVLSAIDHGKIQIRDRGGLFTAGRIITTESILGEVSRRDKEMHEFVLAELKQLAIMEEYMRKGRAQ